MKRGYTALSSVFAVAFLAMASMLILRNGWLLVLGLSGLAALLLHRYAIPRFTLWLFVGAFALRLGCILVLQPPIQSDFLNLYNAAQGVLAGKPLQGTYYTLWAYQSAYVAWEALWLSIWNSPYAIRLVHAFLSAGTVCLLYRMVLPYVLPLSARFGGVMLAVYPFGALLPTILTNQIPAAFFLVLGLWLLICPDAGRLGFWRYPLAGLALQMGNLLRPEGVIVLVAVLAWLVFSLIRTPKQWKTLATGVAVLLAVYFLLGYGVDWLVRATGLNPHGLDNLFPEWKFICGLNPDTSGQYSSADWELIGPTLDANRMPTAETRQLAQELIAQRLHRPLGKLWKLNINKLDALWGRDGMGMFFGHLLTGSTTFGRLQAYTVLRQVDRAMFFLSLGLAALGLWKKCREPGAWVCYFVFFAAFCAFIPIEVQPRYAYMPQLFLFAAAAFGVDWLTDRGKEVLPCL